MCLSWLNISLISSSQSSPQWSCRVASVGYKHPWFRSFRRTSLSPWSWALLERSLVVRALDSFPAFYGTRRSNTEFTRALHLSLSWARPIQSTSSNPTSTRSILILSNQLHLGLPSGLLPSGFPTNNLYAFLFSPIRSTCQRTPSVLCLGVEGTKNTRHISMKLQIVRCLISEQMCWRGTSKRNYSWSWKVNGLHRAAHVQDYNFACGSIWLRNLVSDIEVLKREPLSRQSAHRWR
jgi:hypothetical protein